MVATGPTDSAGAGEEVEGSIATHTKGMSTINNVGTDRHKIRRLNFEPCNKLIFASLLFSMHFVK